MSCLSVVYLSGMGGSNVKRGRKYIKICLASLSERIQRPCKRAPTCPNS